MSWKFLKNNTNRYYKKYMPSFYHVPKGIGILTILVIYRELRSKCIDCLLVVAIQLSRRNNRAKNAIIIFPLISP